MADEPKPPAPWPLDALEGAKMILYVFRAIAPPQMRDTGFTDPTDEEMLLQSEEIVKRALCLSRANCEEGPMGAFFKQQTSFIPDIGLMQDKKP
jgi:hypothetical protein